MIRYPEESDRSAGDLAVVRAWWQRPSGLLGLALAGITLFVLVFCLSPISWLKGDTDLRGNYRFIQEIEAEEEALEGMALVHARLFPRWTIELSNQPPEQREGLQSFVTLREAVAHDAVLPTLLDSMQEQLVGNSLPARELGIALETLVGSWNLRLKEIDEPFHVEVSLLVRADSTIWVGEFYRKLAEADVMVDDLPVQILVVERVDRTNTYESYLGMARVGATEAIVLVDRIFDVVLRSLWPLLDLDEEAIADAGPVQQAMLKAVTAEMAEGLGAEHFERLAGTASLRRELAAAVESVHARQSCGNTMRIAAAPWNGYNPRSLDRFDAMARMDRLEGCPRVTYDEADTIRKISRQLQRDKPLKAALQVMIAWLTRNVAVHEARHVADDQLVNGLEAPIACEACPERMSVIARAELSAYVAAFAWGAAPRTSFLMGCLANSGGGSRAHRRAYAFALRQLEGRCDQPPPHDLPERARLLEQTLFERTQPVVLPDDYPTTVTIRDF